MQYLLRIIGPKEARRREKKGFGPPVAHLWDGTDTQCRMWSTGGIQKIESYVARATPDGRPVCKLCLGEPPLDKGFQEAMLRDPDPSQTPAPAWDTSATREALLRKLGQADALFDVSERQVFDEEDIRLLRLLLSGHGEPF